jgi:hypothetical protein
VKRDVVGAIESLLAHRTEDLGCYEFVLEAWMEEAASEIKHLRSERRWIPVGERMPEKGQRVLFFVNRKNTNYAAVYAGEYLKVFDVWEYCQASEKGWASAFVTHWMPLPEPPA